jgi:hypothetical protein
MTDIATNNKRNWIGCPGAVNAMNQSRMNAHITSMMNGYVKDAWMITTKGRYRMGGD